MNQGFCSICREDGSDFKTRCSHDFHLECVQSFILSYGACPYCRGPVTAEREVEEFFLKQHKTQEEILKMDVKGLLEYFYIFYPEYVNNFDVIILRLKELDWNFNERLKDGFTFLHHACFLQNFTCIRLLIKSGCHIDVLSEHYITPISYSCHLGNLEVVKELYKMGANIETALPIIFAVLGSNFYVIEFIIQNNPEAFYYKDDMGYTLLHYAVKYCHKRVIKFLIEVGADPSIKDYSGNSLLHEALRVPAPNRPVKYLLKLGLNPNDRNSEGYTPLMMLFAYESKPDDEQNQLKSTIYNFAELLLKNGANLKIRNNQSKDAIFLFLTVPRTFERRQVKLLTKYGANWNLVYGNGQFPLAILAKLKNLELLKCLLESGADPNLCNSRGENALFFAYSVPDNYEIINALIAAGCGTVKKDKSKQKIPYYLHLAYRYKDKELIKNLINYKIDINEQDENGKTILHLAAADGAVGLVKFLVELGADVNCKDFSGLTPGNVAKNLRILYHLKWNETTQSPTILETLFPCIFDRS